MTTEERLVTRQRLAAFMHEAFVTAGLPDGDAHTVSDLMAEADAIGSDGHGIFRLPNYIRRIRGGGINLHPNIRVERERAAMAVVNGDNGMGHIVVKEATRIAAEKAQSSGVAWVGINHSNHAGPAALYVRMLLEHDMIGLYAAVGNANHLPPWGGTEMLLSTNPIAISIPSAKYPPIVLDMATTVAAYGKVKVKAQRGEPLPEGWMIDKDGKPLTDSSRAGEGFLLPIGGPKGYGLGLTFGILAGVLNGAAFGRDVIDFNADASSVTNTGHFIAALDISAFMDLDQFKAEVDTVWETMKSSPTLPDVDEIRLPGERAAHVTDERRRNGVPIHPDLDKALAAVAADLGIDPL
ncbi:MAG: Ldh family oxidoreductase [Pseudomonadota bacterium]